MLQKRKPVRLEQQSPEKLKVCLILPQSSAQTLKAAISVVPVEEVHPVLRADAVHPLVTQPQIKS